MFVFLHQGTYFYVHEMTEVEKWYKYRVHIDPKDIKQMNRWPQLSVGTNVSDVSFGSMDDVIESMFVWKDIKIGSLDTLAALFPATFIFFAFSRCRLRVWTKVMICHVFLAIGKGLLGMITTVPDSIGWHNCQQRLGKENVLWFQQEHSFLDILGREIAGMMHGHMTRFCADMVYSGHTWFVTLYGLGLFNLADDETEDFQKDGGDCCTLRTRVLYFVASVAVIEQCYEVYCVLVNRFHYSLDVILAIILSMLFFTNGAIARWSKSWGIWADLRCLDTTATSKDLKGYPTATSKDLKGYIFVDVEELMPLGSIMVPPMHYDHLYNDDRIKSIYSSKDIIMVKGDTEAKKILNNKDWGKKCENRQLGKMRQFLKLKAIVD